MRFDQTSLATASFHLNKIVSVMSLKKQTELLTHYHEILPLPYNTPSPMSLVKVLLTIPEGKLPPHIAILQQLWYLSHRAFPVPQELLVWFEAGPGLGGSCLKEMWLQNEY